MSVSKVILDGATLIDLTSDTVTANAMLSGVTAHALDGTAITGTIALNSAEDLSASGSIVTVPSGYYATEVAKAVVAGTLRTAPVEIPLMPIFSIDSNGLVTAQQSTETQFSPIFTPGYIDSGYMIASIASSSTYQLTTASASTYIPSSSTQSIPSGVYLTGVQTIAGDTNLIAENIVTGITLFGVSGTAPVYEFMTTEEIWEATESGWGSTSPSYAAAIWSSVAAGWSVSSTITEAQISESVELGWR